MAGNKSDLGSSDDALQNSPTVVGLEERMKANREALKSGGGPGGGAEALEARVAKLEVHVEYLVGGVDEIRSSLRRLDDLPTKSDLETWRWQWLGIGAVLVAMIVGGIIGGLAWIKPAEAPARSVPASQPIVIQLPYPALAPTRRDVKPTR